MKAKKELHESSNARERQASDVSVGNQTSSQHEQSSVELQSATATEQSYSSVGTFPSERLPQPREVRIQNAQDLDFPPAGKQVVESQGVIELPSMRTVFEVTQNICTWHPRVDNKNRDLTFVVSRK